MSSSEDHKIVVRELIDIGKNRGFKINESGKELSELKKKGYRIKPDVVWKKDGKIRYIFEVDRGAYDNYPKTIYGSMLVGIILSKFYDCTFYEITFKSPNSKKVMRILKLFKKYVIDSKKIKLIIVPYRKPTPSARRNYYWYLTKKIR